MTDPTPSPWRVPLFSPDFGPDELEAVARPVRDAWLTMGQRVAELETAWCRYTGADHSVAVTNGTAALHLAVMAAGIGPGDEVLVPTLTFVATANAIRYVGATPVFVESVGEHDLNLDPADCARKITPRTKAILLVHYAGFPADMQALLDLAQAHRLKLIEDSAHAVFSRTTINDQPRMCGSVGVAAAFSCFSNKNLTCGEGGMVTTNDEEIDRNLRLWRSHGMTTLTLDRHHGRAISYDVLDLGFNYRLDEIRASFLLAQLERLPGFLGARHRLYLEYKQRLSQVPVTVPFADRPEFSSATPAPPPAGALSEEAAILPPIGVHIMPVLLPSQVDRKAVMGHLKKRGVQSSIHYPPIHHFEAYARLFRDAPPSLPRTEALAGRQLTLPLYPTMTSEDLDLVVNALAEAIEECKVPRP